MSERAVVAFHSGDVTPWYRSQWGGRDEILSAVLGSGGSINPLTDAEWQYLGRAPLSRAGAVVDFLTTEVCYLVTPSRVWVSLPCWFGLGLSGAPDTSARGLFVPVVSREAVRRCRRCLRRLKAELIEAVTAGRLGRATAQRLLDRVLTLLRSVLFQSGPGSSRGGPTPG